MCGIYGYCNLSGDPSVDPMILRRMGAITTHRGPDDEGFYSGEGAAIGMRRLSIIDLSGGHQPIANEDRSLWVVCNGEIYGFKQLRDRLEASGHVFATGSDTEVIVHLYEEHGDDFINHLDGMFAFALWDCRRHRLIIGRDRIGIKPLYYYADSRRLVFASELKAILTVPGIPRDLDSESLQQYLSLGYVQAPRSLFASIKKLPPASVMNVENSNVAIRRYWLYPTKVDSSLGEEDWISRVRQNLEDAVASQMVSDVPLGAFLSGGIDSSAVVAMMARNSTKPIKTYSIGFDTGAAGEYYNELPYARRVSELFGTEHKEIVVRPDVMRLIPRLLWHMDEPIADTAFITTYLVSEFARQDVTVILSGVGGDELFGGYRRYLGQHYSQYYQAVPRWLRSFVLKPIAQSLPSDRHSPLMNLSRYARTFVLSGDQSIEDRYKSYIRVFNETQLERVLSGKSENPLSPIDHAFLESAAQDDVNRLIHVDMLTQMPDDLLMLTDKMTMAASLECRVPLLDDRLVELAAGMPSSFKVRGGELKYILKRALKDLLPDDILHRKKRGFGAPVGAWLKKELAPLVRSVLSRESLCNRGIFRWEAVRDIIEMHDSSREDNTEHLLAMMNFEIWCRIYLDGESPENLTEDMEARLAS